MSSIAITLAIVTGSEMAGFSALIREKFSNNVEIENVEGNINSENDINYENASNSLSLYSTREVSGSGFVTIGNVSYIYDAAGLAEFRNSVNEGNNYAGKVVYLMSDIDMSSVCSAAVGSWVPIGGSRNIFCRNLQWKLSYSKQPIYKQC